MSHNRHHLPDLLVKTFPLHFPFICTPNFPRSLFFYPEYGSSRFLRSARTFLQHYAASHPPEQYTFTAMCVPDFAQFPSEVLASQFCKSSPSSIRLKAFRGYSPNTKCGPRVKLIIPSAFNQVQRQIHVPP